MLKPSVIRSHEERNLLNPAFCSTILWHAARGALDYSTPPRSSLSFVETFLLLAIVLHEKSRESLPIKINSSLPVWIKSHPILVASLPRRTKTLVPFTRDAILFGCSSNLFDLVQNELVINQLLSSAIKSSLKNSSPEVQLCMKKAEFVGKWFAHTGSPETVFTLFGVRP